MLLLGRRVERDDLGHRRAVAHELGVDEGREAVAVRNLRVCRRRVDRVDGVRRDTTPATTRPPPRRRRGARARSDDGLSRRWRTVGYNIRNDAIAAASIKERTLEQTGGIVALLHSQHLTHMATFLAQVQSWRKSMMPT